MIFITNLFHNNITFVWTETIDINIVPLLKNPPCSVKTNIPFLWNTFYFESHPKQWEWYSQIPWASTKDMFRKPNKVFQWQNCEADIPCGPQMLSTDLLLSTNTTDPKEHSKI